MTVNPEVKEQVEVKVPETPQKAQETPPVTASSETPKLPEETIDQINWRKFRQERKREREEKAEADKRLLEKEKEASALKAAMEALLNKPNNISPSSSNLDGNVEEDISEDARIQKKVDKAFEERQRQFETERQKREAAELPQRLSSTFNDFNQVCSQENMDYLEYHYPEVWAGFKHSSGNFDVWSGLYKTIKRLVPNTDTRKEVAKMEKNLSKPQSMSNPGISQTGDQAPIQLTEQRRKDNWARMVKAMKGI